MSFQIDFNKTFEANTTAIKSALRDCNDETIESRVSEEIAFMSGTGNALDDDHIAITRALDYGLISNIEHDALWDMFVSESQEKDRDAA